MGLSWCHGSFVCWFSGYLRCSGGTLSFFFSCPIILALWCAAGVCGVIIQGTEYGSVPEQEMGDDGTGLSRWKKDKEKHQRDDTFLCLQPLDRTPDWASRQPTDRPTDSPDIAVPVRLCRNVSAQHMWFVVGAVLVRVVAKASGTNNNKKQPS